VDVTPVTLWARDLCVDRQMDFNNKGIFLRGGLSWILSVTSSLLLIGYKLGPGTKRPGKEVELICLSACMPAWRWQGKLCHRETVNRP